jgi:hypothetical protein
MILFELKCGGGHTFEAWFRNGDNYESQVAAGEVACPTCGDARIEKAPMAPRIGKSRDGGDKAAAQRAEVMAKLRELRKQVESNCDYVGDRFAEEARKIYYGEVDERAIYGETTPGEAEELREEGVPFAAIPWVPTGN